MCWVDGSVSSDQNRTVRCQSSSLHLIYVWCASSLPSVADWSVESFQGILGCLFSRKLCLFRCLQKPRMLLFLYVRVNKKRRHKERGRRWGGSDWRCGEGMSSEIFPWTCRFCTCDPHNDVNRFVFNQCWDKTSSSDKPVWSAWTCQAEQGTPRSALWCHSDNES